MLTRATAEEHNRLCLSCVPIRKLKVSHDRSLRTPCAPSFAVPGSASQVSSCEELHYCIGQLHCTLRVRIELEAVASDLQVSAAVVMPIVYQEVYADRGSSSP